MHLSATRQESFSCVPPASVPEKLVDTRKRFTRSAHQRMSYVQLHVREHKRTPSEAGGLLFGTCWYARRLRSWAQARLRRSMEASSMAAVGQSPRPSVNHVACGCFIMLFNRIGRRQRRRGLGGIFLQGNFRSSANCALMKRLSAAARRSFSERMPLSNGTL